MLLLVAVLQAASSLRLQPTPRKPLSQVRAQRSPHPPVKIDEELLKEATLAAEKPLAEKPLAEKPAAEKPAAEKPVELQQAKKVTTT